MVNEDLKKAKTRVYTFFSSSPSILIEKEIEKKVIGFWNQKMVDEDLRQT